jgi:diadenosine tetraphosphate (Ap4A) HIT family hydrolase
MDCIFCQIDRAILAETKLSLAFFDGFPVSTGYSLVVPRRHVATIWQLSAEEYVDLFNVVKEVKELIQFRFEPQGINVSANCGEAAGQTVFHAHIHIIPRYSGDVPNPRGGVRNIIVGKGSRTKMQRPSGHAMCANVPCGLSMLNTPVVPVTTRTLFPAVGIQASNMHLGRKSQWKTGA